MSADSARGALHILGYGPNQENRQLNEALKWVLESRDERNKEILSKLARAGIPITMPEVRAFAGSEVVGRPHFAQALIQRGYVRTRREAFSRFLGKGCVAHVERSRISGEMTCEMIRAAGGVPSIAHPFSLELDNDGLFDFCANLKEFGLMGLECFYPEHTPKMQREYVEIADELGLIPTGGSDFHGAATPDLRIGRGFGKLNIGYEIFDRIAAAMVR